MLHTTIPHRSRRTALLSLLALASSSSVAFAFPVEMRVVGTVSLGKTPQLLFFSSSESKNTVVSLKRNDGRTFRFVLGTLRAGQEKELSLDGTAGRYEYEGHIEAEVEGKRIESPVSFSTVVAPPLMVEVDKEDLDLERHTLRFVTSRPASTATLSVIGVDGAPLSKQVHDIAEYDAKQPIVLSYANVAADELLRLELHVEDEDGFYRTLSLTPWSVRIPHQEVLFSTDSAEIRPEEESKLEESLRDIETALQRYRQIRGVQLFIAGHSDTKGQPAHNRDLSRRRARAIAAWFLTAGLAIKVYYEGFGESLPAVKTADEVDEPRNRRADYILSVERPSLRGGAWRALN